jgi:5'(3')-deoxyribonucleotidase
MKDEARRYNSNKPKYSLLDKEFLEEFTKVMTYGHNKYTVKDDQGNIISTGRDNWRKGLSWSDTIDSLNRHLAEFRDRELFDSESKLHHMAHIACNAMFLHYYSKHRREFDDMPTIPLHEKRIGLDIDEVLADFLGGWRELYPKDYEIHSWNFEMGIKDKFKEMKDNNLLDRFYLSLKPLIKPEELTFEPTCYITNRPVDSSISEQWLYDLGFPQVPVITTNQKAKVCKEMRLDAFVDDNFYNYQAITKEGILCYLYDQPHNRKFHVGYKRIKLLKEIF